MFYCRGKKWTEFIYRTANGQNKSPLTSKVILVPLTASIVLINILLRFRYYPTESGKTNNFKTWIELCWKFSASRVMSDPRTELRPLSTLPMLITAGTSGNLVTMRVGMIVPWARKIPLASSSMYDMNTSPRDRWNEKSKSERHTGLF